MPHEHGRPQLAPSSRTHPAIATSHATPVQLQGMFLVAKPSLTLMTLHASGLIVHHVIPCAMLV